MAFLLGGLICITGCSVPPPRFGIDHNEVRKEKGLPIVKSDWRVRQSLNSEAAWSTGYQFGDTPGHSGKTVLYPNGKLSLEEDYYYSGKSFVPNWDPDAGTISEMVTIQFDYTKTDSPWKCYHRSKEDLAEIPLNEAERIIQSWGLKRLNYEKANN